MSNFITHNIPRTEDKDNPNVPKIFKNKNKVNAYTALTKSKSCESKPQGNEGYAFKHRHFPPYITEWVNSVYCYNKHINKLLPSLYVNTYSLIKSYFNLYIVKYNKNIRSKRLRIRTKKSFTKKLMASKPSMKHTNDKISITIYTYDRSSIYYTSKINETLSIDLILKKKYYLFFRNLKKKFLLLKNKMRKSTNILLNQTRINRYKSLDVFNKNYLNDYVKKVMWTEIISIRYKQCIFLEQSKYEKQHLQLLTNLLEKVYNKKIVLDIVNLKYFYNSSNIFSNALLTKFKMKDIKATKLLSQSLDTFDIPPIDRVKIYNEMYNKKIFKQNSSLKNIVIDNNSLSPVSQKLYNTGLDNIIDK